jgi:hypothetical protein
VAYTPTVWIDKAVQFAKRYFINTDGGNDKNLLPPFTDWTLNANATVNSSNPYEITLIATAGGQASSFEFYCLPNQIYTLSLGGTKATGLRLRLQEDGVTKVNLTEAGISQTYTTGSTASKIKILADNTVAGTFTFTNPMLEQASSATAFAPKKMYTITQSGGTVTAAGTPVNAAVLNKMEQGIADALPKDGSQSMTGSLKLTNGFAMMSKLTGYKSWTMHHPTANSLILAPSTSIDAEDWEWSKQIIFNTDGSASIAGNNFWHDGRLRVHSSGNYLEWLKGGTWQAMGGVITVPSDTIQQSFDTEYIKPYVSNAVDGYLVAKFTPKFTGEIKIKFDLRGTNTTFSKVWIGRTYNDSGGSPASDTPPYYAVPLGTLVTNPITAGTSTGTGSATYTTYTRNITVKEPTPIYVFFTADFVSGTVGTDFAYIKNIRMCYDII